MVMRIIGYACFPLSFVFSFIMVDGSFGKNLIISYDPSERKPIIGGLIDMRGFLMAEGLANESDPIRKKYWLLRVDQMKQKRSK
jgi:hypothetical protein